MLFGTENFEIECLKYIQSIFKCEFMDFIMPIITAIGDIGALWIIIGIVLTCIKRHRRVGIGVLMGLLLGFIFGNLILKNALARPRPCWLEDGALLLIQTPEDFSFPSGHTLSSFIAAFLLKRTNNRVIFGGALTLAILIAFSRLYLFVHFPTDILGGIAIAYLVNVIVIWLEEKILETDCKKV